MDICFVSTLWGEFNSLHSLLILRVLRWLLILIAIIIIRRRFLEVNSSTGYIIDKKPIEIFARVLLCVACTLYLLSPILLLPLTLFLNKRLTVFQILLLSLISPKVRSSKYLFLVFSRQSYPNTSLFVVSFLRIDSKFWTAHDSMT